MFEVRVKRIRKYDEEFVTYRANMYSGSLEIQFRSAIKEFPGPLENLIRGKINDHIKITIEKEEP